jgi:hypothetical protein
MPCKITNIVVRTLKPIARVISSTFNPTANVIKNIGINIKFASVIDPDAAAWINGAAADILDTETTVENFLGKALPWNW